MKIRYFVILAFFFFLLATVAQAQDAAVVKRSTIVDTYKGKPYFVHFVKQGETLTAISKAYKVSIDELIADNPTAQDKLNVDMVLLIPQKPNLEEQKIEEAKVEPKPVVKPDPKPAEKPEAKPEPKPIEKPIVKPDIKSTEKPEVKLVEKPEAKPVAKPEPKPEPKLVAKPDTISVKKVEAEVPKTLPVKTEYITYKVKKQETLYGISKQFNVGAEDIIAANPGIKEIKTGMELKIPLRKKPAPEPAAEKKPEKPEVKTTEAEKPTPVKKETLAETVVKTPAATTTEIIVKQGETLYSLSKKYNISTEELKKLNPELANGIKAGMKLKIKAAPKQAAAVTPPPPVLKQEADAKPEQAAKADAGKTTANCFDQANVNTTYNIALLLPFNLADSQAALEAADDKKVTDFPNFEFMQFYNGFMMAADSLEKYGLKARINVIDGDKLNDTAQVKQALRAPGMNQMDLIVGPMYAPSFAIAANFAKKYSIPIVNPLSKRETIVIGNPFVFKVQPSPAAYSDALAEHVSTAFSTANVIIVRPDLQENKLMVNSFVATLRSKLQDRSLRGSVSDINFSTEAITGVAKALKPGVKNLVIFFSNNRKTVPNFVSLLNQQQSADKNITLIGMEGWEKMEMETDFLVNLNYQQLSSSFIDYESPSALKFITAFKSRYNAIPDESKYAYLGYDIGWYFLSSLMQNGIDLLRCAENYKPNGLEYDFRFNSAKGGEGFSNASVKVIQLKDYKWRVIYE